MTRIEFILDELVKSDEVYERTGVDILPVRVYGEYIEELRMYDPKHPFFKRNNEITS